MMMRAVAILLCLCGIINTSAAELQSDNIYKCGVGDEKKIALTFDDGPHPEYTPRILSVLEEYSVTATFFLIGDNAAAYPEIVKKEVEMGCELGNHTKSHRHIKDLCYDELIKEMNDAESQIRSITGRSPNYFRPPEGVCTKNVGKAAMEKGYFVILWTVDTRDWEAPPANQIVKSVKENLRPGAIILFHDYVYGSSETADALKEIIPYVLSEGYEIVSLNELLGI